MIGRGVGTAKRSRQGTAVQPWIRPNKQHFQAPGHFGFECMTSWNSNGFTSVVLDSNVAVFFLY